MQAGPHTLFDGESSRPLAGCHLAQSQRVRLCLYCRGCYANSYGSVEPCGLTGGSHRIHSMVTSIGYVLPQIHQETATRVEAAARKTLKLGLSRRNIA